MGLVFFASASVEALTSTFVLAVWPFYALSVAAVYRLRTLRPDLVRPYKTFGYPWVPALYMVLPALVLGNMFVHQQLEALVGVTFIALGAVVFGLFLRRPANGAAPDAGIRTPSGALPTEVP